MAKPDDSPILLGARLHFEKVGRRRVVLYLSHAIRCDRTLRRVQLRIQSLGARHRYLSAVCNGNLAVSADRGARDHHVNAGWEDGASP